MSSRLLCRKKRRNLAENRTQWTISGVRRNFQDEKGSFRGKISIFGGKSTEYSMGCCIAKSSWLQVVLLQILYGKILMYVTLYKPMGTH